VLKNGGIARLQLNGLPPAANVPNTWEGVRFSREQVAEYARDHDFQLLALEGAGTQYMWTTWRKQPPGWRTALKPATAQASVQRSGDAHTGEPAVPASGRFAYVSFWMERLPADVDLNDLEVTFEGASGTVCYIGPPEWGGLNQLNVLLPRAVRTGLLPVVLQWLGKPLAPPVWLRIISPGPRVPRICSATDATNLLAGTRIESRMVKLILEDLTDTDALSAAIDGQPVENLERFSTDPLTGRFELNFRLPQDLPPGPHQVEVRLGPRPFPPVSIEVV